MPVDKEIILHEYLEVIILTERETEYQQSIMESLKRMKNFSRVDLVVGIPYLAGEEEIQSIISIIESGLDTFYPGLQSLIICVMGSSSNTDEPPLSSNHRQDRIFFLNLPSSLSGRGWAVRGLMDIAHKLSADLLVIEPNLLSTDETETTEGLTPDWIKLMYQPIHDEDVLFILPRFKMSHLANSLGSHFIFPLLASLFSTELHGCLDAGMAISKQILPDLTAELAHDGEELYEFGLNYWLISRILQLQIPMAEVYLGVKPRTTLPVGMNYLFSQAAHILFRFIDKSQETWKKTPPGVRSPLAIGNREDLFLKDLVVDVRPHIVQFRRGYNRYFEAIWSRVFSDGIVTQLEQLIRTAAAGESGFNFPATLWAQVVYEAIIAYHFIPELEKEDLVSSLAALFEGRLAGYFQEIAENSSCSLNQPGVEYTVCPLNARSNLESQVDAFINRKTTFIEQWLHHKEKLQPFLPEISYWEYIPGIPILLPHVVRSPSGRSAHVYGIYEKLLQEYTLEFKDFIAKNLGMTPEDGSEKVSQGMKDMIEKLENDLDELLLPGSLHNQNSVHRITEKIFQLYPAPESMSLKEEVAERLLRENPPRNLITSWGYSDTSDLLDNHNALDILALAPWSEENQYSTFNTRWLLENLTPDDFEMSPILPVVVDYTEFPALIGMREASTLDHLTSRVVISNLREGSGGQFPKIRFLTTTLKRIIEAEEYGKIWDSYIRECGTDDFAERVINSIGGHWGISMFSAHSVFEHLQQTVLKKKLLGMATHDWGLTGPRVEEAQKNMERLAKVYHLGLTLPDGVFISCCIWSWASYSFKGGKGIPTPLSLMVERRWFSGELFMRLYEHVQGERSEIMPIIAELMGQGRENEDLALRYLGSGTMDTKIIVDQKIDRDSPPAGRLSRSTYNPILAPIAANDWENKYVLNCGVIRIQSKIHIFYRAVGDDGKSRIGLAITSDGYQIEDRLSEPVFSPETEQEKMGCEDPRLVSIDGRVYMLYTAYDGVVPQIALASISQKDLVARKWDQWQRHGMVFPGFPNKDAVMFPERFDGKLALYHRIAPSIWLAYSEKFDTPWPREGHKIIMGTRSGMVWDAVKIGAGAQPLKTKFGWLHIYHGVDYSFRYSLGVFVTALHDPARLIYRSPNPIMEPEASYELGVSGRSWVPNVVFTCGAVPTEDREILDEEDEILVYYGGADTVIGVATAKVKDLIPEKYRKMP